MRNILYALLLALAVFAFTRTEGEKETPDGASSMVLAVDGDLILAVAESQAPATELVYENAAQEMAVPASSGQVLIVEKGNRSEYYDPPEYRDSTTDLSTTDTLQKQHRTTGAGLGYPLLEFQG